MKKQASKPAAAKEYVRRKQTRTSATNSFPIVGIGASAGGLEAFTELLKHLPVDTGMGFVLVQHLDPVHESALTKLLAKATLMPVRDVTNNLAVEPNHVYVIPPNTTLSIAKGVLRLQPRKNTRTAPRSIDSFLESLADDERERAVGVILSGTATDGTVGLEAIKAEGGITFAQDDSARFDSMPRSAIAAGCVDFVLSPSDIAKELARIARHPYVAGHALELSSAEEDRAAAITHEDDDTPLPSGGRGSPATGAKRARAESRKKKDETDEASGTNGFKKILLLLRNHSGVDFSLYKSNTIQRRIARRVVLNKHESLDEYADSLRGNTKELDALYSDALISVTSFFRNQEAFDVLKRKVFSKLLHQRDDDPVRIWVLGCSTGQEAYSLSMAFIESADKAPRMPKLQVFATDLNDVLLEKARQGLYARSVAGDITPQRLRRFFVEQDGGYRVVKSLREMVVFARQNLVTDPPFSRMDLISCRNLLIYLEPSLQKKALPTFHYALKPNGFLFLGASESIGTFTDLFAPIDKKHKIFSRKATATPIFHLPMKKQYGERNLPTLRPTLAVSQEEPQVWGELNAQREADRMTVNRFAPPGVLINAEMQITQFRGPTSAYLQPPNSGKATFDVLKMAREGLMLPLRATINKAKKENRTARRENVPVNQDGDTRTVNIEVIPLSHLREQCYLVLFEEAERLSADVAPESRKEKPKAKDGNRSQASTSQISQLESELAETRDYLQSIQEQYEATNEELQASNEEIQSANEEMQSVIEELETSKEELESTNEELMTVNEEMTHRNAELDRVNSDLINLQSSTKLPIVLLGRDLTIRRFSAQAEKQFNLLATDVGRSISSVRHEIDVPDLEDFISKVISDVREREREVQDKKGRWFSLRVRPYLTLDNKVDGAVMVIIDIEDLKRTQRETIQSREYAENIVRTVHDPLLVLDSQLRVEKANEGFYKTFEVSRAKSEGHLIYELGNGQWNIPELRELLEDILPGRSFFNDFEVTHIFEKIGQRTMLLNARKLREDELMPGRILLGIRDITERKLLDGAIRSLMEFNEAVMVNMGEGLYTVDVEGLVTSMNAAAEKLFGWSFEELRGKRMHDMTHHHHPDGSPFPAEDCLGFQVLKRGEPVVDFEDVFIRKDGTFFDVVYSSSPLKTDKGIHGLVVVFRDITERKQYEMKRAELLEREHAARQEAENANRVKDEFLAVVSHELRAPLNAILGWSHMLMRGNLDEKTAARGIETIARNARSQNQLISDLLDVSRIMAGQLRCELGAVDLIPVINAALDTVRPAADVKGVKLQVDVDRNTGMVAGDATRLQQIVSNLLTNAVKFTPSAGQVGVLLKRENTRVVITVSDTGEGISPEFLPHIFERFRQAESNSSRQHGGLGLGLAIVHHLVAAHHGTVSASSAGVGKGATFTVTFPLLAVTRDVIALEPEREMSSSNESLPAVLEGIRILVVDDEPDARDLLTVALVESGAEVRTCSSVSDALSVLDQWKPDILVSDIGMPGEDGYQLIRKLRERESREDGTIRAVALTGYASSEDAERATQAGYNAHIAKPVTARELANELVRVLKR